VHQKAIGNLIYINILIGRDFHDNIFLKLLLIAYAANNKSERMTASVSTSRAFGSRLNYSNYEAYHSGGQRRDSGCQTDVGEYFGAAFMFNNPRFRLDVAMLTEVISN
jgi:hypothetical protein